ncbi:MAG: hypothetical protein KAX38_07210 [Candidatus Krumholzibacteria bacterium]|nr:hypothetical protein [Candidatus Krumholzibacteria bacterium]
MKSSVLFIIIALGFSPVDSRGQDELSGPSVFSDYLNVHQPESFLHIPGLEFHSSAGFSFFSSKGSGSVGMGYYLGHFDLCLSSSLTLHWDVGFRSMMTGPNNGETPDLFLPNVDLTYRPSDKFMLRLQFQQYRYLSPMLRRRY